jgi:hypothetical protein
MSRKIFNDNANDTIASRFKTIAAFWNIRKGAFSMAAEQEAIG